MSPHQTFTRIRLQSASELRTRNNGEVRVANPAMETSFSAEAAEAVLEYRFDAHTGEHVIRLVSPAVRTTPEKGAGSRRR